MEAVVQKGDLSSQGWKQLGKSIQICEAYNYDKA